MHLFYDKHAFYFLITIHFDIFWKQSQKWNCFDIITKKKVLIKIIFFK